MAFSKNQLLEIEKKLNNLPEHEKTENLNKLESLQLIHDTLIQLKNKGYTTKLIAELLTDQGFPINSSLLTSYLSLIKRKNTKKPKKLTQNNSNNPKKKDTIKPSSATNSETNVEDNTSQKKFINTQDSEDL